MTLILEGLGPQTLNFTISAWGQKGRCRSSELSWGPGLRITWRLMSSYKWVASRLTNNITQIRGLTIPLKTTHGPPIA